MPKRKLDNREKQTIEFYLRDIMTGYPHIQDPVLKAKTKKTIIKIFNDYDVRPFGYKGLPDYLKI